MIAFLLSTVAISLSGVMAPGPITAATLAAGARSRHAGAMIALGHAVVEIPLILLLGAGAGSIFQSSAVRAGIGLVGGAVLALMGGQLLLSLRGGNANVPAPVQRHSLVTGIVLTGANPYFLVWWATVGLALTTQAMQWGVMLLVVFGAVHWLCDLVWLEVLSMLGFKGSETFGRRAQTTVSLVCGIVLLGFGAKFLCDASWLIASQEATVSFGVVAPMGDTMARGVNTRPHQLSLGISRSYWSGRSLTCLLVRSTGFPTRTTTLPSSPAASA